MGRMEARWESGKGVGKAIVTHFCETWREPLRWDYSRTIIVWCRLLMWSLTSTTEVPRKGRRFSRQASIWSHSAMFVPGWKSVVQLGFALPATWLFIVANRAKLDSASHFWMVKLKATFFVRSLEAVVVFFWYGYKIYRPRIGGKVRCSAIAPMFADSRMVRCLSVTCMKWLNKKHLL